MADQPIDHDAKDMAYKLKEIAARHMMKPSFFIHKTQCYVAVQTSPEKRALCQLAGRFSGIFAELSGDDKLQTNREYGQDYLTILGWSVAEGPGDKNAHLQQKASSGRWLRVAEWGRRT